MSSGDWHDLLSAAVAGDVELVRFHLGQGVDPGYVHPEVQATVLVSALLAGREEIAHVLLDHGADPEQESVVDGLTPLQAARRARLTTVEARLLALGAEESGVTSPGPPSAARPRRWWWPR